MANCKESDTFQELSGKVSRKDDGYYYVVNHKQFYRKRDESYHQHLSPKQRWLSEAFRYGQREAKAALADPTLAPAIEQQYKASRHKAPNGKVYGTPLRWKAAILQQQWKTDHPFEQWYETYLATISQEAAAKTANENASQYMIKQQIKALQAQPLELEKRLEK